MLKPLRYDVVLRLKKSILGTKSADPSVLLGHLVETARKGLAKYAKKGANDKVPAAGMPFVGGEELDDVKVSRSVKDLRNAIERWLGEPAGEEEWAQFVKEGFAKNTLMYSRLQAVRGATVFPKDESGRPFIDDYMLKGFFKSAAQTYTRRKGEAKKGKLFGSGVYTAKIMNEDFWVAPQRIYFWDDPACSGAQDVAKDAAGKIAMKTRPLQAKTPQGPRTALTSSEKVEASSYLSFQVKHFVDALSEEYVRSLLEIGEDCGLGQWRTAGWGSFSVESFEVHK